MHKKPEIALNRFGLGARPGDLNTVAANPAHWLLDQLQGPSRPPATLRSLPDSASVLVEVQRLLREHREKTRAAAADPDADIAKVYGRTVRRHYATQTEARYQLAAATEQPFHERLVHFWSNHFAISAEKQPVPAIAGLYENEAIRPHVAGRFGDLLLAVEQHPAMLMYLDNQRSIGPASRLGKRAKRSGSRRSVGLNENLAREILELHTLGVDAGYTQQDVTSIAKIITGWSIGGAGDNGRFAAGEPGEFTFREVIHEPGPQTVLGKRYAQKGLDQGETLLRDLAIHPSTARFIATKLARHFVADEPPEALVDTLTATFLETDGDLPSVYTALIESPFSWQALQSKYKTPNDFVISTLRAFNYVPDDARLVIAALDLMGQTPFRPGSPAGWPDTADQWGGADALYKRIEWSNTVARRIAGKTDPLQLGNAVLGEAFMTATQRAVSGAESRVQGTTLLLASPDFQRR